MLYKLYSIRPTHMFQIYVRYMKFQYHIIQIRHVNVGLDCLWRHNILFFVFERKAHNEPVACAKSHATLVSADHGLHSPAVMSK